MPGDLDVSIMNKNYIALAIILLLNIGCVSRNIVNIDNASLRLKYNQFQGPHWDVVINYPHKSSDRISDSEIESVEILSTPPVKYIGNELDGYLDKMDIKNIVVMFKCRDKNHVNSEMIARVSGIYRN